MIDDYEIHDLRMEVAFEKEYQYKLNRFPNCRDPDHPGCPDCMPDEVEVDDD